MPYCFTETSETPGTVETLLHPKNSQKRGKNAVIKAVFERSLGEKQLFLGEKRVKNDEFYAVFDAF